MVADVVSNTEYRETPELFWGFGCLGASAFAAAVAAVVAAAAVPASAVVAAVFRSRKLVEICDSFSGRVGIVLRYSSHSVITFIAVSIQHAVIILHLPLSHLIFNCCFKWQADCNHYVTSTVIAVSIQSAVIILHLPLSHLIFNCCFKWQADCNQLV